ncbi:MAG: hypothetical protein Q9220_002866 [cf. Caloplaca sp. 1 TL-2023]
MAHAKAAKGPVGGKRQREYQEVVYDWFRKPLSNKDPNEVNRSSAVLPSRLPDIQPAIGQFSTHRLKQFRPVGAWTPVPEIHMPYNNAAIPPSEEITGSASLPLARVKRILALDEDIHQCSNSGAFVITVATEMFIRYLAEQAMNVVKSERKPRRNIQYKDLASAVARIDNLEFLADVIPKTTTFREIKEKKAKVARANPSLAVGQTTLDNSRTLPSRPADVLNSGEPQDTPDETQSYENEELHDVRETQTRLPHTNGRIEHQNFSEDRSNVDREASEDIEMG